MLSRQSRRWSLIVPVLALLWPMACLVDPDPSLMNREAGPDYLVDDLRFPDSPATTDGAPPDSNVFDGSTLSDTPVSVDVVVPDTISLDVVAPDTAPPVATLKSVRSGTGTIAAGASSTTVSLSPAVADTSKTTLFFQATSDDNTPASANVRCRLASASTIACDRFGTVGTVNIRWYIAEFSSGVAVQHLEPTCVAGSASSVTISAVDPSKSFVLLSSQREGSIQSDDDFTTAQLTGATSVEIANSVFECGGKWALQVVQLDGASVVRGVTGSMTGTSLTVSNLPSAPLNRSFLLYSYRTVAEGPDMCERMIRGQITTSTSVKFSRGDGASGCAVTAIDAIAWERVELPAGTKVQQVIASMPAGSHTLDLALASQVDQARTVVFAGGQWTSGQSIGEGSYLTDDVIGEMVGRFQLTSTTNLQVKRDSTGGTVTWSAFVVEF